MMQSALTNTVIQKKCMEICLSEEESNTLLALQRWISYFENSKELLKI